MTFIVFIPVLEVKPLYIILFKNRACETLEEQISLQEPILKQRLRDTGFLNKKTGEYQRQLDQLLVSQ